MEHRNWYFIIFAFWFFSANAQPQRQGTITGSLLFNENVKVFATVYLLSATDSALVKLSLSDSAGNFKFENVKPGKYIIKVTMIGYETKCSSPITVKTDDSSVPQLRIGMQKKSHLLAGVTINAGTSLIDVKPNKTVINVQNSILASGNSAFDILMKAPGVQVDQQNNISLFGRSNVSVSIDGSILNIPVDALVELLKSTQGNNIAQVELINSPGAEYDAAGAGGVINIKTTRNYGKSENYAITQAVGLQQPTEGHALQFKTSDGFSLYRHDKKFVIMANYTFTDNPVSKIYGIGRTVDYYNQVSLISDDSYSHQNQFSNQYRFETDYNINAHQSIGVFLSGTVVDYTQYNNVSTAISDASSKPDSSYTTTSRLVNNSFSNSIDVNYKADWLKKSQLLADVSYLHYDKDRDKFITNNFYYPGMAQPYQSQNLQDVYPVTYNIYSIKINYSFQPNRASEIKTSLKSTFISSNSQSMYSQQSGYVFVPIDILSNTFNFSEKINAAGVSYSRKVTKKLDVIIGLRAEYTYDNSLASNLNVVPNVNRNDGYLDLFPSAIVNQTISSDDKLSVSFGRRISRPDFDYLNPFITYIDPLVYNLGNPNLKPVYANNFELLNIYQDKLSTRLLFSVVDNFSQAVYKQNDTNKVLTNSRVNLGTRYQYGLFVEDNFEPYPWWNFDLSAQATIERFVNNAQTAYFDINTQDAVFSMQNQFKLPAGLRAELFGTYEIPTTYGVYKFKADFDADAAIGKSILHKKGSLRLAVNDVFNNSSYRFNTNYQGLNLGGRQVTSFRLFQLRFTYNFTGKALPIDAKLNTATDDSESRTEAGNN